MSTAPTLPVADRPGLLRRALRLEYDDVDERVTEIAAPAGQSMDVMRMVDE